MYVCVRKFIRYGIGTLVLFSLLACKEGDGGFSFVEDIDGSKDTSKVEAIQIQSFSPTADPIRVTNSTKTTFLISINSSAGDSVSYSWELNSSAISGADKSFYELDGADALAGVNTLKVTATNSLGSESKTFNVEKNKVPVVDSSIPAAAGNSVNCGSSIAFTVNASDPDADSLTYTWKLNGAPHSTYYSIASTASSSVNTFSPACALAGVNSVTVDISDGYDTTSYTWSVTVSNPSVANITSYSPSSSPIIIPSTGSQSFSISATGKSPMAYKWQLNGTDIPGETNAITTLTAASLSVGDHTLRAIVTDSDSSDNHDFSVKRNAPPVLSNASPTASTKKINYQSITTFSIDGADANSDSITYTWTLDDLASAKLATSATANGSQAIFSPDSSLIGSHTIKVVASDGTETASQSWTVEVNYFSDACNDLTAGKICTIMGAPGMGSGVNPTTTPNVAKVFPTYIENDGNDNYFISDETLDVVWFYNRSGASITVLNVSVPAGEIKVVAGTGVAGYGTAGDLATKYPLNNPKDIAWDSVNKDLYIASYDANRVVKVASDGKAYHHICSGSTSNNESVHTEGAAATSHACRQPAGLEIDTTARKLFVANYGARNIKYFDISDADPANWTGHILVGRKNGSGSFTAGSENGDAGGGSTSSFARTNGPWDLSLDKDKVLHFTEYSGCRVRAVNTTGSTRTFFGGGISIADGKVMTLFGTGNCGVNTDNYTTLRVRRPRGLQIYQPGGVFKGWFVSNDDYDRISFVNNTASSITMGNQAVASYTGNYIWGNGQDGYNGDAISGKDSLVNYVYGITLDSTENKIVIADRNNYRVRSMEINVNDGNIATLLAGKEKEDFSGGSNTPSSSSVLNRPSHMVYDSANNSLIISDTYNGRIRSLNLTTGAENTIVGQGAGNGDQDQEDPLDVYMRGPRAMVIHNNSLVFADRIDWTGANNNCLVRVYNRNATTTSFWNTSVIAGKVATIAGNFTLGCASFDPSTMDGNNANTVPIFNPEGLASDGTNLYISAYRDHCIMKLASDGTLSRVAGECGTQGDTNATPFSDSSVRLRHPGAIAIDPDYAANGNLFIADQTNRSTGRIKYLNNTSSTVTIAGISVAANSIGTIFNTPGYSWGVATFDNQVCYTSGHETRAELGNHNIICKRKDDPLGNITLRVGPADGSTEKGSVQLKTEDEGQNAASVKVGAPYGLAFDNSGNLYITERGNSVVRMVKKWW